jgi:hypothetical protein
LKIIRHCLKKKRRDADIISPGHGNLLLLEGRDHSRLSFLSEGTWQSMKIVRAKIAGPSAADGIVHLKQKIPGGAFEVNVEVDVLNHGPQPLR